MHKLPVFEIKNFSFSYPSSGKTVKITGNITIHQGERVLIKGPSGSGKSTLLLALSRIIPDEIIGNIGGKIVFYEKDITSFDPEELHRKIGIVFQNPYSQRVTTSIEDELVFYLENLGYSASEIDKRLKKIQATLNLAYYKTRSTKKLSGGELQKIILASVLIAEPEVLLLDEPTSYLDIKSEISFYKYLKNSIKKQTILLVDHKLNHGINLIERIIELDSNGKILYDGPRSRYKKEKEKTLQNKWIVKNHWLINDNIINKRNKLEIKNLSFSYGGSKPLLKNINLSIESGKVTSIFGLNGSGKTTIIKLASRLIKVGSKNIVLNGKTNLRRREFYKHIGVVFQNPETHFLFQSVEKEITNGSRKDNAKSIARTFNITDNIYQNPFTLSEGQKRRLNLANIFYSGKNIIMLDEPTFGQDENGIENLIYTIKMLKNRGAGFLIVSHDTNFIRAVSDRVFYLTKGKLLKLKIRNKENKIYDTKLESN